VREGDTWRLYAGDEHVADLVVSGFDFPWLEADVVSQPGLDRFRSLFDDEVRYLDEAGDEEGRWAQTQSAIRRSLRMTFPDGRDVPEWLLHIDGDEAWWRFADDLD
jgi:hypothetical protein